MRLLVTGIKSYYLILLLLYCFNIFEISECIQTFLVFITSEFLSTLIYYHHNLMILITNLVSWRILCDNVIWSNSVLDLSKVAFELIGKF